MNFPRENREVQVIYLPGRVREFAKIFRNPGVITGESPEPGRFLSHPPQPHVLFSTHFGVNVAEKLVKNGPSL